jgi:hypothetical protein
VGARGNSVLLGCDAILLDALAAQAAASIIDSCDHYPAVDDGSEERPTTGVGKILVDTQDWDSVQLTNGLQSQVRFLYTIATMAVDEKGVVCLCEPKLRRLVVRALCRYQAWKTEVCREGEKRNGEGWGSRTGFHTMDWTDLNDQLMSTMRVA